MENWIISSKREIFDLDRCLLENGFVDWKQNNYHYNIGDIAFMYCTKPLSRIKYMMLVEQVNISYGDSVSEEKYWGNKHKYDDSKGNLKYCRLSLIEKVDSENLSFENLKAHGLSWSRQGSIRLKGTILDYIRECFAKEKADSLVLGNGGIWEGALTKVTVNRYERNPIARQKCIEKNGCVCAVCGMDFGKVYGDIGKGFIHVHHVIPISSIGEEYEIDYEKDLIPVCPNCHAMLHRGRNGRVYTVNELKEMIEKQK